MKSARGALKRALKNVQKEPPLLDMTPALATGPSKVTPAQIRKAVRAVVKARRAK